MVKFVIAKYNEDVDWVKHLQHSYIIYDKSDDTTINKPFYKSLKNVGREGETFLYHIVNNYDNLDEVTVFLQGNPFDHLQSLSGWRVISDMSEKMIVIDKMNTEITDDSGFATFYQVLYNVPNYTNNVNTKEACLKYYNKDYNHFTVCPGAQYIVPKQYILSRPLEFWKTLHQAMYNNEELNGYCQEMLWYLAYTHNMNYNVGNHDIEKMKNMSTHSFSNKLFYINLCL